MSHTTTVDEIVFSDIEALKAAVAELNSKGVQCSLVPNATPRAFYTNQEGLGPADWVLNLSQSRYDVGFYRDAAKKGLVARADFFGSDISRQIGAKRTNAKETDAQCAMGKLNQLYAVHAATRQAIRQGYNVQRRVKEDGSIQLVLTGA